MPFSNISIKFISGTELTKANLHTADGISVRFPRVTRIRDDKDWESATNLEELKHLFKTSKEKTDVSLLNKLAATASESETTTKKIKNEKSPTKVPKIDTYFKKDSNKDVKGSPKSKLDSFIVKRESIKVKNESETPESKDNIVSKDETDSKKHSQKRKHNERTSSEENEELDTSTKSNETEKSDSSSKRAKKRKTNEIDSSFDEDVNNSSTSSRSDKSSKKESKKRKYNERSSRENTDQELNSDTSSKKHKKKHDKRDSTDKDSSSDTVNYEIDPEILNVQSLPKNPLPDVFLNKRLGFYPDFISFTEEERDHFERHWIAYGGIVVKSIRSMDVDYVVHNNEEIKFKHMQKLRDKTAVGARHVNKYWLIKCINDVKLYDTDKYAVIVNP